MTALTLLCLTTSLTAYEPVRIIAYFYSETSNSIIITLKTLYCTVPQCALPIALKKLS